MSEANATGYLPGDPRYGLQGEALANYYRTKAAQWAIYCWDKPGMEATRRALLQEQKSYVKSFGERVIGTIRRECLDWLIPLSEPHLRSILKEWVTHYNRGRPHMSLGPGVPDPPQTLTPTLHRESRHRIGAPLVVCAKSVLGGLHHEYSLAPTLA